MARSGGRELWSGTASAKALRQPSVWLQSIREALGRRVNEEEGRKQVTNGQGQAARAR